MDEVDIQTEVGNFNSNSSVLSLGNLSRYGLDDVNDAELSSEQQCWLAGRTCFCNTVYVLTAIGLVGNFLTFLVVLRRPSLRQKSTFVYILFLAGADQLRLLQQSGECFVFTRRLKLSCEALVVIAIILKSAFYLLCFVYILALTVERLIIIFRPLQATALCTRRKALLTCSGLAVLIFLLTSPIITLCYAPSAVLVLVYIFTGLEYTLWFVIAIAISAMTVAIVWKLRNSYSLRQQLTGPKQRMRSAGKESTNSKVNILLITTLTAFVVITGPLVIFQIYRIAVVGFDSLTITSTEHNFIWSILFLISLLNHNTNFFLYVASARIFRDELVKLFMQCIRYRCWNADAPFGSAENDGHCLSRQRASTAKITASTSTVTSSA